MHPSKGKGVLMVIRKAKSAGPCPKAKALAEKGSMDDADFDADDSMDRPERSGDERARDYVRKANQLLSNAMNYLGHK